MNLRVDNELNSHKQIANARRMKNLKSSFFNQLLDMMQECVYRTRMRMSTQRGLSYPPISGRHIIFSGIAGACQISGLNKEDVIIALPHRRGNEINAILLIFHSFLCPFDPDATYSYKATDWPFIAIQ